MLWILFGYLQDIIDSLGFFQPLSVTIEERENLSMRYDFFCLHQRCRKSLMKYDGIALKKRW